MQPFLQYLPPTNVQHALGNIYTYDFFRLQDHSLQGEIASRALAESERNALLVLEQNARARAEEQNAAKDEFLAMLGHELRNPLSAVASAVAILDRSPDDATAAKAREVLRRQTNQLRKMVDDLLEVNRALMGKLTLETAPLDLAEIVRRCLDTLHASGRTARFTVHLASVPSVVNADPARLMQVIDNILDNAIKYSPDESTIRVEICDRENQVEVGVTDDGPGIGVENRAQLMQRFFRPDRARGRNSGGFGLGLSITKAYMRVIGGSLQYEPAQPRGSTFRLVLPKA